MGCFFVPLSKLPWKRVFYYYLGMGRPADQEGTAPEKRVCYNSQEDGRTTPWGPLGEAPSLQIGQLE